MKTLFLALALASCLTASARAGKETPAPREEAPILRYVKATGKIRKIQIKYKGDSVDFQDDVLCTFEKDVPVYDLRESHGIFNFATAAECKTTVHGKPAVVRVSAMMQENAWGNVDGTKSDSKMASATLHVRDKNAGNGSILDLGSNVGTKDMNAESLLVFLRQEYQPDTGNEGESFAATIEFKEQR